MCATIASKYLQYFGVTTGMRTYSQSIERHRTNFSVVSLRMFARDSNSLIRLTLLGNSF